MSVLLAVNGTLMRGLEGSVQITRLEMNANPEVPGKTGIA